MKRGSKASMGESEKVVGPIDWSICCSVAKLCLTLCNPMDCSAPGFPVSDHLLEFAQNHIHWIRDTIQQFHLYCLLLILPSIFLSIRVFFNESVLRIRWPKYWNFSFSISPSNEYLGLISFRMDWFDLLAVQEILKSLLEHHRSKASFLWHTTIIMCKWHCMSCGAYSP